MTLSLFGLAPSVNAQTATTTADGALVGTVLTLSAPSPYKLVSSALHLADSRLSTDFWLDSGFRLFDFGAEPSTDTSRASIVLVDIESSKTYSVSAGQKLFAMVGVSVTGYSANGGIVPIPITAAGPASGTSAPADCVDGSNCGIINPLARPDTYTAPPANPLATTRYFAAAFSSGTKLRIGIYPKDVCDVVGAITSGPLPSGCTVGTGVKPSDASSTSLSLTVYVGVAPSSASLPATDTNSDSQAFTLQFHNGGPALTCPTASFYEPGDQSIRLTRSAFTPGTGSGGAPVQSLLVVANKGTTLNLDADTFLENDIVARAAVLASGATESNDSTANLISGFKNSTTATPVPYKVGVTSVDAAGVVRPIVEPTCVWSGLQTADIKGAIAKGQCFVAGATYREGDNPGIQALRTFRDRILLPSGLGRNFVKFYYAHAPTGAAFVFDHPVLRWPLLSALLPVVAVAAVWGALGTPSFILLIVTALGLACAIGSRRFRGKTGANKWVFGILLAQNTTTISPYIDELKAKAPTPAPATGFLENEQARLKAGEQPPSTDRYSEGLKSKLGEPAPALPEQYLNKVREELQPQEPVSTIANVTAGKGELKLKRPGDIRHAIGFQLSAWSQPTLTGKNGAAGAPFESIYRDSWNPEFRFTYEFKPLYSEWFGSLGLYAMGGFSFYSGKGSFSVELIDVATQRAFPSTSKTQFTLYQVPVSAGLHYRMNLLYWLRPHAQVGPAIQFFSESRSDNKSGYTGFSTALYYALGLSILLDGISRTSDWNLYADANIKHFYLTAEYVQFLNLGTDLAFNSRAVSAGFVFEF